MKIVSVLNHKGGVGKTTFAGSIAQALALSGYRVLAIDNDSQHNLSALLGTGVCAPCLQDVYRADTEKAKALLLKSIRKTELGDLHIITSSRELCDADVSDEFHLKNVLDSCGIERYYDFIMIDNAPGLTRLQAASINACDEIFVPTELKQFAVNGLTEMEQILAERFPGGGKITRIIPNFYKDTKRHNTFISALQALFPGRVTATVLPVDNVFDEVVTEGKVLFIHRLYSRGAAYYLKLMHELFNLNEDDVWEQVLDKRKERFSEEARERYFSQQQAKKDAA
ncbi:MAG: AAA family ATPase [Chitinivibrionales bacterium]|nr:AAA family ATPase [Chitinivibrionales bacterium]